MINYSEKISTKDFVFLIYVYYFEVVIVITIKQFNYALTYYLIIVIFSES